MKNDELWSHRRLIEVCLDNGVPFFWRGPGNLLIAGTGIVTVLRSLENMGQRVLGLEGFELESAVVHPRLDLNFDLDRSPLKDPVLAAERWDRDIWVDVTLAPRVPGQSP